MKKVIINFSGWRDALLDKDAQYICGKMKDNAFFPMLVDEINAVIACTNAYHLALIAAPDGGREAHVTKEVSRKALIKALRVLGFQINEVAEGREELLASTGYPVAKTADRRRQVQQEAIALSVGHRSIQVTIKEQEGAGAYHLQYTPAPVTEASTWVTLNLVAPFVVINGLETDKKYAFRVAAVIHLEELEYSAEVVSRYVY